MTLTRFLLRGALLCLAAAFLPLPSAHAGDIGSEPANFSGEYDHRTGVLTLTWDAPAGLTAPSGYRVYRDAELLGTTTQPTFDDDLSEWLGGAHVYHAVAVWGTAEGNPSLPLTIGKVAVPGNGLPCEVVRTSLSSESPFAGYALYPECLPV